MPKREDMLVMSSDPGVIDAASLALQLETVVANCRNLAELTAQLQRSPAPIVLVDIDASPRRCLTELEAIIPQFDQCRFVVAASSLDQTLMLEAMQIGARHFMSKARIASELGSIMQRLLKQSITRRPREQGEVISIISAGGGCGCTTISVNLANELGLTQGNPALVVDLDLHYGAISTYLGLRGQYGVADVLNTRNEIDPQLISSTALPHSEHLHALLSPVSVQTESPASADLTRLPALIDACRSAYRWTVIDAPRLNLDAQQELSFASRLVLVVFQLTVKDIHNARAIHAALVKRGVAPEALVYVINRYRRSGPTVPLEEAQKALGDCELTLINNDFRPAIDSINFGQPLASSSPRSTLRQDMQKLANHASSLGSTASRVSTV